MMEMQKDATRRKTIEAFASCIVSAFPRHRNLPCHHRQPAQPVSYLASNQGAGQLVV
jgi:hypothetical protein